MKITKVKAVYYSATGNAKKVVEAIATAVLSKKGKPFRGTAILGILFGVIAILAGVVEFAYLVMLTTAMKNPDYAPFFNQVFEQMEQMGYFDMLPESVRP